MTFSDNVLTITNLQGSVDFNLRIQLEDENGNTRLYDQVIIFTQEEDEE